MVICVPRGVMHMVFVLFWQDISNNLIEEFPPSIGELSGLKRLDLQSNKVELFPEGINVKFSLLQPFYMLIFK